MQRLMKEFIVYPTYIEETFNAKPAIPVEKPQRREIPETKPPLELPTPNPLPVPEPLPVKEPVKSPSVPVPVGIK